MKSARSFRIRRKLAWLTAKALRAFIVVLLVLVAFEWLRSYSKADDCVASRTEFEGRWTRRWLGGFRSERGGVKVLIQRLHVAYGDLGEPATSRFFKFTAMRASGYPQSDNPAVHTHLGFALDWGDDNGGGGNYIAWVEIRTPWPAIFAVGALATILLIAGRVGKPKRPPGFDPLIPGDEIPTPDR